MFGKYFIRFLVIGFVLCILSDGIRVAPGFQGNFLPGPDTDETLTDTEHSQTNGEELPLSEEHPHEDTGEPEYHGQGKDGEFKEQTTLVRNASQEGIDSIRILPDLKNDTIPLHDGDLIDETGNHDNENQHQQQQENQQHQQQQQEMSTEQSLTSDTQTEEVKGVHNDNTESVLNLGKVTDSQPVNVPVINSGHDIQGFGTESIVNSPERSTPPNERPDVESGQHNIQGFGTEKYQGGEVDQTETYVNIPEVTNGLPIDSGQREILPDRVGTEANLENKLKHQTFNPAEIRNTEEVTYSPTEPNYPGAHDGSQQLGIVTTPKPEPVYSEPRHEPIPTEWIKTNPKSITDNYPEPEPTEEIPSEPNEGTSVSSVTEPDLNGKYLTMNNSATENVFTEHNILITSTPMNGTNPDHQNNGGSEIHNNPDYNNKHGDKNAGIRSSKSPSIVEISPTTPKKGFLPDEPNFTQHRGSFSTTETTPLNFNNFSSEIRPSSSRATFPSLSTPGIPESTPGTIPDNYRITTKSNIPDEHSNSTQIMGISSKTNFVKPSSSNPEISSQLESSTASSYHSTKEHEKLLPSSSVTSHVVTSSSVLPTDYSRLATESLPASHSLSINIQSSTVSTSHSSATVMVQTSPSVAYLALTSDGLVISGDKKLAKTTKQQSSLPTPAGQGYSEPVISPATQHSGSGTLPSRQHSGPTSGPLPISTRQHSGPGREHSRQPTVLTSRLSSFLTPPTRKNSGSTIGSGTTPTRQHSGLTNGSGTVPTRQHSGQTSGSWTILTRQQSSTSKIPTGQHSGPTSGSGTIPTRQHSGPTSGSGTVTTGQHSGQTSGSGTIPTRQHSGPTSGSGTVTTRQHSGPTSGSGTVTTRQHSSPTSGSGTTPTRKHSGQTSGSWTIPTRQYSGSETISVGQHSGPATIPNGQHSNSQTHSSGNKTTISVHLNVTTLHIVNRTTSSSGVTYSTVTLKTKSTKPDTASGTKNPAKMVSPKPGEKPSENKSSGNIPTPSIYQPTVFIRISLRMTLPDFCSKKDTFMTELVEVIGTQGKLVEDKQIAFMNMHTFRCKDIHKPSKDSNKLTEVKVDIYIKDSFGNADVELTESCATIIKPGFHKLTKSDFKHQITKVELVPHSQNIESGHTAIPTKSKEMEPGVTIAVVIASVGGVCCVTLLILQIIIHRRSGKRMKPYFPGSNRYSIRSLDSIALGVVPKSRPNSGFWNPGLEQEELPSSTEPSHPLGYNSLSNFIRDSSEVDAEFETLPHPMPRLSCVPVGAEDKNRFANVIPYPHTRVKLKKLPDEENSTYINANYVTGYRCDHKAYIATQDPMKNTVNDFWRMIWEQQSRVIIMLTPMDELGQPRCSPYWPESDAANGRKNYGDYTVTLKKKDVTPEYTMSVLELKDIENNLLREIRHFWYTCWPIDGTPEPISFVKFVLDTRPHYEDSGAAVVVHCSPGTGRTGSFIALDICMRSYESKRTVNVANVVHRIRQERAGAVQTKEQYQLIYKALNEYATVMSSPSVSANSSVVTLHNML